MLCTSVNVAANMCSAVEVADVVLYHTTFINLLAWHCIGSGTTRLKSLVRQHVFDAFACRAANIAEDVLFALIHFMNDGKGCCRAGAKYIVPIPFIIKVRQCSRRFYIPRSRHSR